MNQTYTHPVSGKPISRQRWHQLKNVSEGLCQWCREPIYRSSLCKRHYAIHLLRCRMASAKAGHKSRPHTWLENKPDLSGADWSKTTKELAKEFGTTYKIVEGYRIRSGAPVRGRGRPKLPINWDEVDFDQEDKVVGLRVGACYGTVCNERNKRGIPPNGKPGRKKKSH